jgi:hypothetical protein
MDARRWMGLMWAWGSTAMIVLSRACSDCSMHCTYIVLTFVAGLILSGHVDDFRLPIFGDGKPQKFVPVQI